LQSKKENSTGEQTKNHDFIETYLVRQFATHEPSMDPNPKATIIQPIRK
jgi:hypothetical protein